MALYYANSDGNAPSGLKVGDIVHTGSGGDWQILDANKYKNMSSDQLKSAGVSYNPATGYYSKKSSIDSGLVSNAANYTSLAKYRDTDLVDKWKTAYLNQQVAALQNAYNINLANITKSYNDNYKRSYDQIASTKNDYAKNIQTLYDNTYKNNALALQQAANRGMTSAAQGVAMGTSGLMDASKKASDLTSSRDTLISNIQTELNRLTTDYNIDKDLLSANFSADKINAMSTADLQWLQAALDIENENNETYNSFLSTGMQNYYNSSEAEKERAWQEQQTEKGYQHDIDMAKLNAELYGAGGSGGGGGYYSSGGGYYRSGGGGYFSSGSGSGSSKISSEVLDFLNGNAEKLDTNQLITMQKYLDGHPNASLADVKSYYNFIVDSTNPVKAVAKSAKKVGNSAKAKKTSTAANSAGNAALAIAKRALSPIDAVTSAAPYPNSPLKKVAVKSNDTLSTAGRSALKNMWNTLKRSF